MVKLIKSKNTLKNYPEKVPDKTSSKIDQVQTRKSKITGKGSHTLADVVGKEPLFEREPSLQGINPEVQDFRDKAVYFGTGLCNPKELSKEVPFDVLSMVLCSEKIRRVIGLKKTYHFIADSHALSNEAFDARKVELLARKRRQLFQKMAKNFGFNRYEVVQASDFDNTDRYKAILNRIPKLGHEYVRRELTDIEWFRQQKGVVIKMGWIIQATKTLLGFDERLFDSKYAETLGNNMCFLYVRAGRTFNRRRPKASPYIHLEGENRILLKPDEDVELKFARAEESLKDKHLGGARKHLNYILRLYQELVSPLSRGSTEERIAEVISTIFQ